MILEALPAAASRLQMTVAQSSAQTCDPPPLVPVPVPGPEASAGVETLTFGCRLNATESEAMRRAATGAGLRGAVIVNTCAVTGEAVRQARQAIRRLRRERPGARILVTGCAAQIDPDMFAAMPEVDHVLGNSWKERPADWSLLAPPLSSGLLAPARPPARVLVDDIFAARETAGHLIDGLQDRVRGTVQVQTGCDHRCTFCVIPYGRGQSRSVPAGEVVRAVAGMVDAGVPEVVLTGVDLTSWGQDLPGRPQLGDLVARLLRLVPGLARLRLSSIDAIEIDPALEQLIGHEPRVMPHLHLSLQHGSDLILKRMKRRHSRAGALELIARLRAARPELVVGADLIAGFPTETEQDFGATLSLLDEAGLAFVHAFAFSPRPGTPAARMPQLSPVVIKERAARLRAAGAAALVRHLEGLVGQVQPVLMERGGIGRLAGFAPVAVSDAAGAAPPHGALVQVRLVSHNGTRLKGEVVPGCAGRPGPVTQTQQTVTSCP
jgi:threonylcarbamoyladenosine tRNA methylthiotransferase MtaB